MGLQCAEGEGEGGVCLTGRRDERESKASEPTGDDTVTPAPLLDTVPRLKLGVGVEGLLAYSRDRSECGVEVSASRV
jgi:hypothetical protein